MRETLITGLRIGTTALLAISLVLVGIVAVPGVAGQTESYVVLSQSMEPALHPGDVVVVRDAQPSAIQEGDVITYRSTDAAGDASRSRVTHRVVEKRRTDDGVVYRTKGDANDRADPGVVRHEAVQGVVWFHVPVVGHLILFAQRPVGMAVFLVAPGLYLVGGGLRQLVAGGTEDGATD